MQVNTLSVTTTNFVQMDIETGQHHHQGQEDDHDHTSSSSPPTPPTRPRFLISLLSAICCGGGVLLVLAGLILFFREWTKILENAMMTDDNDTREVKTNRKRAERISKSGFIIAVELVVLIMMLKVLVPWAYAKAIVALKLDPVSQFGHLLHSVVWLVAGLVIYASIQGFLAVDDMIMGEPDEYDHDISTVVEGVTVERDYNYYTEILIMGSDDDTDTDTDFSSGGSSYEEYTDLDDDSSSYDEDAEYL